MKCPSCYFMYSKFVNQLKEEINSNMPIKNVQNEDFKFSSEFLIFTISIHIFLKYNVKIAIAHTRVYTVLFLSQSASLSFPPSL